MRKRKFILTAKPHMLPDVFKMEVWAKSSREAINSFLFGNYHEDFELLSIVRCNASKHPQWRNFKCRVIKTIRKLNEEKYKTIPPPPDFELLFIAYQQIKKHNNELLKENNKLMAENESHKRETHEQY